MLAIQYYQKALTIQPENSSLYESLGFIYGLQGNMAEATFNYGVAQDKKNNFLEAIKYYKKAIEFKPNYVLAYYNLATLYKKEKNFEIAIKYYQKVTQLQKDYIDAYYNLGLIYQTQKQLSSAIYNYEQVIKIEPNYQEAYLNLSILYKEQGNITKAFEACQNALQYQAQKANSCDPLGKITVKNQQLSQKQIQSKSTKKSTILSNRASKITNKTNSVTESITEKRSPNSTFKSNNTIISKPEELVIVSENATKQKIIKDSVNQSVNQKANLSIEYKNYTFKAIEKELIVERIVDNQYNFMVTAFFAENELKDALLLLSYLEKTDLSFCLSQTPTIHKSASLIGEINNIDYTKPSYLASLYKSLIEQQLNYERKSKFTHILSLNTPLLLDLKTNTINFFQQICDRDIDFAIYNCLQNPDLKPILNNQIESSFLVSSSAIQLYSLSQNSLLIWQFWQQAIIQYNNTFKQQKSQVFPGEETFIDYVWNNFLRYQSEIKYTWFTQKHFSYSSTAFARTLININQ